MRTFAMSLLLGSAVLSGAALAGALEGRKQISLLQADGTEHSVGYIEFASGDDANRYTVNWDDSRFNDHFLSMRPFKCLEGEEKHWCHVPYPYAIQRRVTADDLTDLEYDLMFLWKGAGEYGINMWNGVYYQLDVDGDRLVGRLHEVDMEPLGIPPAEGDMRPIRKGDLHEADADSHWLPVIVIE